MESKGSGKATTTFFNIQVSTAWMKHLSEAFSAPNSQGDH
jgi:hypothetical protein